MKRIYVVGNPVEPSDRLPPALLSKLKQTFDYIDFIPYDPTEDLGYNETEVTLIDTVMGIDRVTVFTDLSAFLVSPRVSAHDYDLPVALTILMKLGKLKHVTIVGVPAGGKPKKLIRELIPILQSILP